jgi:very-short-patch-repair endonuclease
MTRSEKKLWYDGLRGNQLGYHFRRQHPIEGYVLDFYCPACTLCVEVDGSGHEFHLDHDARRDEALARQGILTYRIANDNVQLALGEVLFKIKELCDQRSGSLPLLEGEGARREL